MQRFTLHANDTNRVSVLANAISFLQRKQARNRDFRTDEQRAAVNAVWVVEFRRGRYERRFR